MDLRIHNWPSSPNLSDLSSRQRSNIAPSEGPSKQPPESSKYQASQPEGVTQEEWRWIQRHFPPSEKLTLRLYGPNRTLQTLQPGTLGSQLDIKG